MQIPFFIADVFSENKMEGNQLAVFFLDRQIPSELMQKIALEINYAETTFVYTQPINENTFQVRIFTPREEVPFGGHPTLGTAYVIEQFLLQEPQNRIYLQMPIGLIPVSWHPSELGLPMLWMEQAQPQFGRQYSPYEFAPLLSLSNDDFFEHYPVEEVSTGMPCYVVPLKTLDAVRRARVQLDRYFQFVQDKPVKNILIFAPETYSYNNNIHVRMFSNWYGTSEDAATGSGNGSLAAYLVHHQFFGNNAIDLKVEQGYLLNRPSLIFLKAEERDHTFNISIGGHVNVVAQGNFLVDY